LGTSNFAGCPFRKPDGFPFPDLISTKTNQAESKTKASTKNGICKHRDLVMSFQDCPLLFCPEAAIPESLQVCNKKIKRTDFMLLFLQLQHLAVLTPGCIIMFSNCLATTDRMRERFIFCLNAAATVQASRHGVSWIALMGRVLIAHLSLDPT
jgi:hypothetical protein